MPMGSKSAENSEDNFHGLILKKEPQKINLEIRKRVQSFHKEINVRYFLFKYFHFTVTICL